MSARPGVPHRSPELLAPAGNAAALAAALHAGADAVYFGLAEGFNARARADNFSCANLAKTVARIHRAGARAYLALNTLVFESELAFVERLLRDVASSGVDALIVQDPAVALLAREICPGLELHASTQMTISSPEAARFAASLGITRVVVPRELSVAEIDAFARASELELEVFVHGALCVAWSGQCLSSSIWSGRSANRGECAQSCRLPYELVVDGAVKPLGDVKYLLSPKDLAGVRAVEELARIGVHGLKIEGRQKNAQYVLTATETYRHWLDALELTRGGSAVTPQRHAEHDYDRHDQDRHVHEQRDARGADAHARVTRTAEHAAPDAERRVRDDLLRANLSYTRGLSDGFLGGSDHQTLVEGRFPKHRGVYLGRVTRVGRDWVEIERDPHGRPWTGARATDADGARASGPIGAPSAALSGFDGSSSASDGPRAAALEPRAGLGVVFDAGDPEDAHEPGGPIFRVDAIARGWRLGFGAPGPDLTRVDVGQRVWASGDPALASAAAAAVARDEPCARNRLALRVAGRAGEPLCVSARGTHGVAAHIASTVASSVPLAHASGAGLGREVLVDKLAAFGGTPFALAELDARELEPGLHMPVSELKALRRALVERLVPQLERGPARNVCDTAGLATLRARVLERATTLHAREASAANHGAERAAAPTARTDAERARVPSDPTAARIVALCRNDAQLEAAIDAGLREVELDWMELVGLARAVERARAARLRVVLATLRVHKPLEQGYDQRLAALGPDALLVRHWAALAHFERSSACDVELHGDFSLNVANSITAHELFARRLATLTPAHDLDRAQLRALLAAAEPSRFTVVLQHRMPTFHTEHCVYAHLLSNGRDHKTCGRPCERHEVALRDVQGRAHEVIVDVGCRNTVFDADVQSAAHAVPELLALGVRRFRVEFVRESRTDARRVLLAYADLLAGACAPREALERARALGRVGMADAMAVMERARS